MACEFYDSCKIAYEGDTNCVNDSRKCPLYHSKQQLALFEKQDVQMKREEDPKFSELLKKLCP